MCVFYALFLFLGIGSVARQILVPRPTEELIALSAYPVSAVYREVLPEIIRRGPDAVDPLIDATRRWLEREQTNDALATAAFFSLGRICTTEAETFLGQITRDRTRPDAREVPVWERAAVYSYARCGGPRALDDLLALHENAGDQYRWL